jgi:hypothetical protein
VSRAVSRRKLRRIHQEAALLRCGEFFRDELHFGPPLTARQQETFRELCRLCFDALGNPSMAEVQKIKERAK